MTEFKTWTRYMQSRRGLWSIDPIHDGVARDLIAFCPDRDDESKGVYVAVAGSRVTAGTYEHGIPHLTEGMFTVRWERDVGPPANDDHGCAKPTEAAFKFVAERLGVRFLREALCM